nr:hypothetical protein [bacterium]
TGDITTTIGVFNSLPQPNGDKDIEIKLLEKDDSKSCLNCKPTQYKSNYTFECNTRYTADIIASATYYSSTSSGTGTSSSSGTVSSSDGNAK